jgi:hypothetical protein
MRCGWPERLFSKSCSKAWKHSFYAFYVTQPVRGTATPLFDVFAETHIKGSKPLTRFSSECVQYSTFSAKINDLQDFRPLLAISAGLGLS